MIEVAVGILKRSGKILLCQRKKGDRYGLKWEFPGGKTEPGETMESCLRRELREELSIEIGRTQKIRTIESFYKDGGWFRVSYYLISDFKGEPANNIFEQIVWVLPEELKGMDILEGNKPMVQNLIRESDEEEAS
jgi:8-oxo-dGTP diphosphatase